MMQDRKIIPKCVDDSEHFIAANGRWLPCCVFPTHGKQYEESIFNDKIYNITENTNVHAFHKDVKYLQWLNIITNDYNNAPRCCQKKCGINAARDENHNHNHETIRYDK